MQVKQISVFLENKVGRLAEVTKILGEAKINIRALTISETLDFGVLRMIVDRVEEAYRILKENNFTVSETKVVALEIPDKPGGLAQVMNILAEANINVEYLYAFLEKLSNKAILIVRFENPQEAIKNLQKNNINLLPGEKIYSL